MEGAAEGIHAFGICRARDVLDEYFECVAGPREIGEHGVVQREGAAFASKGGEELCLIGEGLCLPAEAFAPVLEIRKIDVAGDVLPAEAVVDLASFDPLLMEVGADRAARAAMVKRFGAIAVVDGEEVRVASQRRPGAKPLGGGEADLEALALGMGVIEGGAAQGCALEQCLDGFAFLDLNTEFAPFACPFFVDSAGERIDELVGKNERPAFCGLQRAGHGIVPMDAVLRQAAALFFPKDRGGFHDMVVEAPASEWAEAAEDGAGELAGARADLDEMGMAAGGGGAAGLADPICDGGTEGFAEGGGGGEIPAPAHGADIF